MTKCAICKQDFLPFQKLVRMVVEVAVKNREDDPDDPARWSDIEDWDDLVTMHLGCVRHAVITGDHLPYANEISTLDLLDLEDNNPADEPWVDAIAEWKPRFVKEHGRVLGVLDGGLSPRLSHLRAV